MDGMALIGHDNGRIVTLYLDEVELEELHSISHFDGEVWGLSLNHQKGTFYTCGDDNHITEIDCKLGKVLRTGKVWSKKRDGVYSTSKT